MTNPNPNPELSILLVNFNGKRFLDDCLIAIAKHVSVPYEIILVDNCSTDGSAEYVEQNHPETRLIRNTRNVGFAAGNNLAASSARGKYVLLLNNDTILQTDVNLAIRLIESRPTIGAVGFKMLSPDLRPRISTGHFPAPWRLIKFSSLFDKADGIKGIESSDGISYRTVDWIEGSFIFTTRSAWDAAGGLDEGYFMYVEDVDFCQAIHRNGMQVAYVTTGAFIHYGGYSNARLGLLISGYRRYHKKYSKLLPRLAANSVLSLGLLVRLAGFGIAYLATRDVELKRKSVSCAQALFSSPW